jgi:hypothetical protein
MEVARIPLIPIDECNDVTFRENVECSVDFCVVPSNEPTHLALRQRVVLCPKKGLHTPQRPLF